MFIMTSNFPNIKAKPFTMTLKYPNVYAKPFTIIHKYPDVHAESFSMALAFFDKPFTIVSNLPINNIFGKSGYELYAFTCTLDSHYPIISRRHFESTKETIHLLKIMYIGSKKRNIHTVFNNTDYESNFLLLLNDLIELKGIKTAFEVVENFPHLFLNDWEDILEPGLKLVSKPSNYSHSITIDKESSLHDLEIVNDGIDSVTKNTSISKEVVGFLRKNNLIDDRSDMYFEIVDNYQINRIKVEIMA